MPSNWAHDNMPKLNSLGHYVRWSKVPKPRDFHFVVGEVKRKLVKDFSLEICYDDGTTDAFYVCNRSPHY